MEDGHCQRFQVLVHLPDYYFVNPVVDAGKGKLPLLCRRGKFFYEIFIQSVPCRRHMLYYYIGFTQPQVLAGGVPCRIRYRVNPQDTGSKGR